MSLVNLNVRYIDAKTFVARSFFFFFDHKTTKLPYDTTRIDKTLCSCPFDTITINNNTTACLICASSNTNTRIPQLVFCFVLLLLLYHYGGPGVNFGNFQDEIFFASILFLSSS